MAFTLGVGPTTATGSGSTVTLTLNGTTAGRQIIVGVHWRNAGATISSITCSGESALTVHGSPSREAVNTLATQVASLANITAGGNKTITVTMSSAIGSSATAWAMEVAGGDTASFFDATAGFNSSSNITNITQNVTVAKTGNLLIGAINTGGVTPTAGSGFTGISVNNNGTPNFAEYDLDSPGTGAQAVAFVNASGTPYALTVASFNVDSSIPKGTLTLTGYAPDSANSGFPTKTPVTGALSLNGLAPSVLVKQEVLPSRGAMTLTGIAPSTYVTSGITLLLRSISATGSPGMDANFDLLLRTITATGKSGQVGTISFTTPLREIVAGGQNELRFGTPLRTLLASGVSGNTGSIDFGTPLRSITASAMVSVYGSASLGLLLRSLQSSGVMNVIASLSFATPRRIITANAYVGQVGTAAIVLPLREILAKGYPQYAGTGAFTLPLRYLQASGFTSPAEIYRGWAYNLRTGALTEYENFEFNSMVKFGDSYLSAGPNGLFVLGGKNDDGAEIRARARTGLQAYGTSFLKRVPRIYVTFNAEGDLFFKTISSEDGERTYLLIDNGMREIQQRRVPVGQGPKSARWAFEVANKDGADFGVSEMLVYPKQTGRRIQ